jgi:hypothetical protein
MTQDVRLMLMINESRRVSQYGHFVLATSAQYNHPNDCKDDYYIDFRRKSLLKLVQNLTSTPPSSHARSKYT